MTLSIFQDGGGHPYWFHMDTVRPSTKWQRWYTLSLKFDVDPIYSFGDIAIFIFPCFGLKLLIHAHFRGYSDVFPQMTWTSALSLKGPSLRGNTSFQTSNVTIGPAVRPASSKKKVRTVKKVTVVIFGLFGEKPPLYRLQPKFVGLWTVNCLT